jgi:hypothetical protein
MGAASSRTFYGIHLDHLSAGGSSEKRITSSNIPSGRSAQERPGWGSRRSRSESAAAPPTARSASSAGPANTTSDAEDPEVDAAVLSDLAAAIRDHQGVRCYYRDEPLEVEPYHLITWQRRWYLVGRAPATGVSTVSMSVEKPDAAARSKRSGNGYSVNSIVRFAANRGILSPSISLPGTDVPKEQLLWSTKPASGVNTELGSRRTPETDGQATSTHLDWGP